mgnify:CR=1 FL=1
MLSYKDRLRLPYTEAVLLETLRIGNISPTGIPHCIEQDFTVQGKVSNEIVHLLVSRSKNKTGRHCHEYIL